MDAGFIIEGVEFPQPDSVKLGDGPLVREVTGLSWDDFTRALDSGEAGLDALPGLVAISVARKFPGWSRKRVVEFVSDIDFENLEVRGDDTASGDADPPPPAEAVEDGVTSPRESSSPPATEGQISA